MKSNKLAALLVTILSASSALAQFSSSSQSSIGVQELPEPSSLPLVLLALVGAVAVARFIKRK